MPLRRNLIANYLGQGWTALIGIAFIPVYIHYLGMESYGLIGLFAVMQAWLSLLDMGITPTLNRELARFTAGTGTSESINDLVRTFEWICFTLAIATVLGLFVTSSWIANVWLNSQSLPAADITLSLSIMGLVIAMRFAEGLYRGAMLGLQMHVWLNVAASALATVRALGAVYILAYVSNNIISFFYWQAAASLLTIIVFYVGAHRHLPTPNRPPRFSTNTLTTTWKFAGGVLATTVLSLAVTQLDKIILSRLLTLESFGTYAFAAAVTGSLYVLIAPIAQTYYPKLSSLVASRDQNRLAITYHQGAQLMSIMLVPAGCLLIFFSGQILTIWTNNDTLTSQASVIVSILAAGTIMNGWMHIPYMLQLASGWSSFAAWTNLFAAILLVPAIFWITPRYGVAGAAWVWVTVNAGYVLISIYLMHRRLLPSELFSLYLWDITMPSLSAATVVAISRYMLPENLDSAVLSLWIIITLFLAYIAGILGSSHFSLRMVYRQIRYDNE